MKCTDPILRAYGLDTSGPLPAPRCSRSSKLLLRVGVWAAKVTYNMKHYPQRFLGSRGKLNLLAQDFHILRHHRERALVLLHRGENQPRLLAKLGFSHMWLSSNS